jgi:hypothetical protein
MPFLDPNAIISQAKLTQYLLVLLPQDDKSQYLAQGGYTIENWQVLEYDLRTQILTLEATPTTLTQYGQKYAIVGSLQCPNGITLTVKTIWIVWDNQTRFITLFPD